jgi:hypothetical protein
MKRHFMSYDVATAMRLLLALLVCGCGGDPCGSFGGQTCIALEVRGDLSVTQLLVSVTGAFILVDAASPSTPRDTPVALPVALAVLAGDASGEADLTVKGLLGGVEVGRGNGSVAVTSGQRVSTTVTLVANGVDLAPLPDLAAPVDLAGADLRDIPCDPATQSPCPVDQKCVFLDSTHDVCRPAGALPVGAMCSSNGNAVDSCVRGTQCLFPGGGSKGECTEFCSSDFDCTQAPVAVGGTQEPGNVGHCLFTISTQSGAPKICSLACNPVASLGASGCPPGAGCVYAGFSSVPEYTFCNLAGTAGDGQDCSTTFTCQAGFSCIGVGAGVKCRAACRKGTDGDCISGYQCKPGANGNSSLMFGYCCPPAGC